MKKIVGNCIGVILSLALLPCHFIKWFHEVGVLPSLDGGVVRHHYYYSMADNLRALDKGWMLGVSIALLGVSALALLVPLCCKDKKWRWIGWIIFCISVAFFLCALVVSSTVARGY